MPEQGPNLYSQKVMDWILGIGKPKEIKTTGTSTVQGQQGADIGTAVANALMMYAMMNPQGNNPATAQAGGMMGAAPTSIGVGGFNALGSPSIQDAIMSLVFGGFDPYGSWSGVGSYDNFLG